MLPDTWALGLVPAEAGLGLTPKPFYRMISDRFRLVEGIGTQFGRIQSSERRVGPRKRSSATSEGKPLFVVPDGVPLQVKLRRAARRRVGDQLLGRSDIQSPPSPPMNERFDT